LVSLTILHKCPVYPWLLKQLKMIGSVFWMEIIVFYSVQWLIAEVIPMVTFPLAVSGRKNGVHRKLYEYRNRVLRSLRRQSVTKPRYSY